MKKSPKCPVCGKCHVYKHTAQLCLTEILISIDMKVKTGQPVTEAEEERKKAIIEYCQKLPIQTKAWGRKGEKNEDR